MSLTDYHPTQVPGACPHFRGKGPVSVEVYWEGMEAYENGFGAENNHYEPGTVKFKSWYLGWYEASQDNVYCPDRNEYGEYD